MYNNCSYGCAVDIRDIISVEKVMETQGLGPNGGMYSAVWHHDSHDRGHGDVDTTDTVVSRQATGAAGAQSR